MNNDIPKNQASLLSLMVIILLVSFLLGVAGVLLTPASVSADLPPRPTPVPTKTPTPASASSDSSSRSEKVIGAYIELNRPTQANGSWTVVQWQGSDGRWHDVEGWRGTFEGGKKIWWVSPADFGKGSFRWAVYQEAGGPLVGFSPSFSLPTAGYQHIQVGVTVP